MNKNNTSQLNSGWKIYYKLPADLKNAMFDEGVASNVWSITKKKYNLVEESVSVVAKIIGLVMLGEIKIADFIQELSKALNIDIQKASALAQDINEQIFQPVRESLMEIHGIRSEDTKHKTPEIKHVEKLPKKELSGVSIEELENTSTSFDSTQDRPLSTREDKLLAQERRENLIQKLKKNENEEVNYDLEKPQAVTTAWNGRTIDLSKIPPRRKRLKN